MKSIQLPRLGIRYHDTIAGFALLIGLASMPIVGWGIVLAFFAALAALAYTLPGGRWGLTLLVFLLGFGYVWTVFNWGQFLGGVMLGTTIYFMASAIIAPKLDFIDKFARVHIGFTPLYGFGTSMAFNTTTRQIAIVYLKEKIVRIEPVSYIRSWEVKTGIVTVGTNIREGNFRVIVTTSDMNNPVLDVWFGSMAAAEAFAGRIRIATSPA